MTVSKIDAANIQTQTLTSIPENGIQLEAAALFLLAFHVNLELGFAARYPISLDGIRLLGVPTATTGPLADRGRVSKRISCQFAELIV